MNIFDKLESLRKITDLSDDTSELIDIIQKEIVQNYSINKSRINVKNVGT